MAEAPQTQQSNGKEVTVHKETGLVAILAEQYAMTPKSFFETVKQSCFPAGSNATNEMMLMFLAVAREHGLNPFTREIYAFPRQGGGGIQVIVGIDGWMKLINSHPKFAGMEFEDRTDSDGKLAAITCRIHRSDRAMPIEATEYLSECRRDTEPWKKWPHRMLRHKAAIQAARYAFSFSGIADPDEGERIIEATASRVEDSRELPRSTDETAGQPERAGMGEQKPDDLITEQQAAMVKSTLSMSALNETEKQRLLEQYGVQQVDQLTVAKLHGVMTELLEVGR